MRVIRDPPSSRRPGRVPADPATARDRRGIGALVAILVLAWTSSVAFAQTEARPDSLHDLSLLQAEGAADTTHPQSNSPAVGLSGLRARPDLFQHASLSFAIGLGVGMVSDEPVAAGGVSFSLGVLKELTDPHFDRTDLVADLIGATLATAVTYWLSR